MRRKKGRRVKRERQHPFRLSHFPPPRRGQLDQVLFDYATKRLNDSIAHYGASPIAEAAQIIARLSASLSALCDCSDLGVHEDYYCKFATANHGIGVDGRSAHARAPTVADLVAVALAGRV